MKKLDVSSITDSSQMPVKKGTLEFLQLAHRETTAATIQALIGSGYDPAVIYVMSGILNSGTYPAYDVTAGVVFYNGEVFQVDAANFTATGSNVGILEIVQTQYTADADPVTFTDAAVRNIHNIRKMQVVQGASGSGIANILELYYLSFVIPAQLNLTAPTTGAFAGNVLALSGAYPNLQIFVPTPPTSVNPILYAGTRNIGDIISSGGSDFTVTFPAPLSTASYYVMGSVISNGANADNDTTTIWTIRGRTTTEFIIHFKEFASVGQNIAFEYVIFAK